MILPTLNYLGLYSESMPLPNTMEVLGKLAESVKKSAETAPESEAGSVPRVPTTLSETLIPPKRLITAHSDSFRN
jgi:hypothetical protein